MRAKLIKIEIFNIEFQFVRQIVNRTHTLKILCKNPEKILTKKNNVEIRFSPDLANGKRCIC